MSKLRNTRPTEPHQPAALDTAARPRTIGLIAVVLCAIHIAFGLALVYNWLTHKTVISNGETVHQQFAYQAAEPDLPLYGKISTETLCLWYTPLQFQLAGWLARPFDYDIRAMRFTVAFFGVGSVVLVGMLTRRLTGDWRAAAAAAGIFFGLPLTIPWYVIFEPNAGHVFFLLLTVYLLVRDESLSWRTVILAGSTLFLSCWTKHTGLPYMVAGCGYIFLRSPRKGLVAGTVSFGLLAAGLAYYVTRPDSAFVSRMMMHGNNPMDWGRILAPVLFPEYTGRVGILFALAFTALFTIGWKWKNLLTPMHVFLGASFLVGTVARLKYGSGPTQAIAFYALLAVYALTVLINLLRAGKIPTSLATALVSIQALAVTHDLRPQFITAADDARYENLLRILATPGKSTYYNNTGFMNVLVGKPLITGPGWDCWVKGRYDRSVYPQFLRDYWGKDPIDLVIIDIPTEDNSWFLYERLNANYVTVQDIPATTGQEFGTIRWRKIVLMRKDLVPAAGTPAPQ